MMINLKKKPLLTRFEEKIEQNEVSGNIKYDPELMVIVENQLPIASLGISAKIGITRHTRVNQETQDDD